MVAQLVRLRLTLLGNLLKRSAWQIVGFAFAALYGATVLLTLVAGLFALSIDDPTTAQTVVVAGGSVAVLGWWLLPLVTFGVDSTLDPRKLALLPISRRDLLLGLAAAGVVGVPGIVTLLASAGSLVVWRGSVAALLAAVLGVALAVATCVVGSRSLTSAVAPLRATRRFREVASTLLVVLVVLLVVFGGRLLGSVSRGSLDSVADVLAWTPVGAAWGVPYAIAGGQPLVAVARLVVALVTLAALVALWRWALDRTLTGGGTTTTTRRMSGLGLFGRFGWTPTGAVAARCLTYWRRDPRYIGSLVVLPLFPVFLGLGTTVADQTWWTLLLLGPLTAFSMGWAISADVSYDSTAFWLHVVTGVPGRADRLGRVVAVSVIAVPLMLVYLVGSVWYLDRWDTLPAAAGVTLGTYLTALGVSSVASARFVYPVPKHGESAFATPQGATTATLLVQTAGAAVLAALTLPHVGLGIASLVTGNVALGWATLVVGVALGTVLLVVGVRIGSRVYDARSTDLMEQVTALA